MSPKQGMNVPRMGIQRTLIAPGVTPQAPRQPSNMALSLMQLLGQGAQTAQAAAQFAAVHEQMQEMKDTEEGLAAVAAGVALPDFRTVRVHNAMWQNQANMTLDTLDPATLDRLPDETLTDALHRWKGIHTPLGAPDIFDATMLQGIRQKGAAHTIQETRLAQATALNNLASNATRMWGTAPTTQARAAFEAWDAAAIARGLTENERLKPILDGAEVAIAAGWVDRAKQIETTLGEKGRPDLAFGIVKKAENVFDANRATALQDRLIPDVRAGKPWPLANKEIDKEALPLKLETAVKTAVRGAAQDAFEQPLWSDFLNEIGTAGALKKRILKAEKDGIIDGPRAATLISAMQEGERHMDLKARVLAKYSNPSKFLPLSDSDDDPTLGVMLDMGVIDGFARSPNGTSVQYVRAIDKAQWADFLARVDHVPRKIGEQIAANAAHPTQAPVVFEAMRDYLYLNANAPHLADAMLEEFDDLGRLRVHAMTRALDDAGISSGDPASADAALETVMPAIMAARPVDYTNDQTHALIFEGDITAETTPWGITGAAQSMLEETLPDTFRAQRAWYARDRKVETPTGDMTNRFLKSLTAEFKALVGAGWPEMIAVQKAREFAAKDTFDKMRPVVWRSKMNEVVYAQGGPRTTPETGAAIFRGLVAAARTQKEATKVVETYRPFWSEQHQGYILVSEIEPYGEPYSYMRDGKPVLFVSHGTISPPKTPMEAGIAEPKAVLDWSPAGQRRMAQEVLDRISGGEAPASVLRDVRYEGRWDDTIYLELKKNLPPVKD